jgi:uncharacterized protein YbjT (DUF2867 family)
MEQAPPEIAVRAVELDLIERSRLTHSILRPASFMQNFSETFLKPIDGVIAAPTGAGAEAVVDAEDVAAVAAATLADPAAHAGAQYAPTGPEALTVSEAAGVTSEVADRSVVHHVDRDAWIAASLAVGVPPEYGAILRMLTETVAAGWGSTPNNDVEKVTGRPPTPFAEFARRTARAWKD